MSVRVRRPGGLPGAHSRLPGGRRGALALALALAAGLLTGCASRTLETRPAAHVTRAPALRQAVSVPGACSSAVLGTLEGVVRRAYREGIRSERSASAEYLIDNSSALRAAIESDDLPAAREAALALLKTGHLTNVTVMRGRQTLVALGGPALAPLRGTLTSASGTPLASYVASVWADGSFLTEAGGITQGLVALRTDERTVAGSPVLPAGRLADEGALTRARVSYRYTSFPVARYPAGTLRVYLLMPTAVMASLCGRTREDTTVNTLERVAKLIYESEIGQSAQTQVSRVQHNEALLQAVASKQPEGARRAIDALLKEHVVRLRVSAGGRLLADVGGPYVLGPVSAPLRLHGRVVGSLALSIQDDEGYLRLMRRLAGLYVLMYVDPEAPLLVKDSLPGAEPAPALTAVPASGPFRYEGRSYRVLTVHARAFPSGALVIRVLVPIPYDSGAAAQAQAGASDSHLARSAPSS